MLREKHYFDMNFKIYMATYLGWPSNKKYEGKYNICKKRWLPKMDISNDSSSWMYLGLGLPREEPVWCIEDHPPVFVTKSPSPWWIHSLKKQGKYFFARYIVLLNLYCYIIYSEKLPFEMYKLQNDEIQYLQEKVTAQIAHIQQLILLDSGVLDSRGANLVLRRSPTSLFDRVTKLIMNQSL